jgi:5-methylcytosine-specific restriction endonuclease McrA
MKVFENINSELLKALEVKEGCCCYCGRRMNLIKGHDFRTTIDHIKPKSNGGYQ